MEDKASSGYSIEVETDAETGGVLAVYVRLSTGKVAKTDEFAKGSLFADFDRHGRLLGFELLGPCPRTTLRRLLKRETKTTQRMVDSAVAAAAAAMAT